MAAKMKSNDYDFPTVQKVGAAGFEKLVAACARPGKSLPALRELMRSHNVHLVSVKKTTKKS